MNAAWIDACMTLPFRQSRRAKASQRGQFQFVETAAGWLRYLDTGGNKPTILTTPDGPCVIEHYAELIKQLSQDFRVVCFDMPGMGFSFPSWRYDFGTQATVGCILELMDHVKLDQAIFAFTCANGLYAMTFAKLHPHRVSHLVLGQTPSFPAMLSWKQTNIPKLIATPVIGQLLAGTSKSQLASKWFGLSLPRDSEFKAAFQQQAVAAVNQGGCFCLPSLVQAAERFQIDQTEGVQCPVMMVYGDNDFSHRNTDFSSLLDTIPHAQLSRYFGCGHFPNLERTGNYVADLKAFVS